MVSGPVRWRIVKDGFETREMASSITYAESTSDFERTQTFSTPAERCHLHFILDREGSLPSGMIAVDGGKYVPTLTRQSSDPVVLERYFIDRTPVTNKDFQDFVDAGGYAKREYWKIPLEQDGSEIGWEEGMAQLVDITGRPGPATWEMSHYPEGQDDYPVRGVSWYEAAAYAEFCGKTLPTIYHWGCAALPSDERVDPLLPSILPMSNFGGGGPAPVGSYPAISHAGAYDMAGNVREWCWNSSGTGRYSLGGAWSDPAYAFTDTCIQPPLERFETSGFRCMQYASAAVTDSALREVIADPFLDYGAVETISDDAFGSTATSPLTARPH